MSERRLIWSEEFNLPEGSPPNSEIWARDLGDGIDYGIPGWGNNELQVYTSENAFVNENGILEIEARKIADGSAGDAYYGPVQWTSARLVTKNKLYFQYGEIVIRTKVPKGKGLWPAFWMLGRNMDIQGWPLAGEIDIMEWVGREPFEALGTLHGPGYFGDHGCGGKIVSPIDLSDDWHEYGIRWKPDYISWQLDGETYFEASPSSVTPNAWVYNQPFSMLLNVAVGGNLGGVINPELPESNKLLVDYIRIYEYEGFGEVITP
ncbi:MAG: family 16 glycosylhydrolase [Rhodoluna sp.]